MQSAQPDLVAIYQRAHLHVFNAPYVEGGIDLPKPDDPDNLRQVAFAMFSQARFEAFLAWLATTHPGWRTSAVALHLVGAAYYYMHRFAEGRGALERALEMRQTQDAVRAAETLVVLSAVALDSGAPRVQAWGYLQQAAERAPALVSVHINRLCLASLEHDEKRLHHVYGAMREAYPAWSTHPDLCERLRQDGELAFARQRPLWQTIVRKMGQGAARRAPRRR